MEFHFDAMLRYNLLYEIEILMWAKLNVHAGGIWPAVRRLPTPI